MLKFLIILIILYIGNKRAQAISCWQCNSFRDNPKCADVPKPPVNVDNLDSELRPFYYECGTTYRDNSTDSEDVVDTNQTSLYTLCRKQVQTIDGVTRIIRQCGIEKSHRECYTTANPPVKTYVCDCFSDGCNYGSILNFSQYMLAFAAILFVIRNLPETHQFL